MLTQAATQRKPIAIPVPTIPAQARGKLRIWKTTLSAQYNTLSSTLAAGSLSMLAHEFVTRQSVIGRSRVLRSITKTLGKSVYFERCDLQVPFAIFSLINPTGVPVLDSDEPSDAQPNVCVDYFAVGALGDSLWRKGFYSIQVPDHALGRCLQRLPKADLSSIMIDAHRSSLQLRVAQIAPYTQTPRRAFLLKAGDGAFTTLAWISPGDPHKFFLRAETWLHSDQLFPHRTILMPDDEPGEKLGERLLRPF
jgi:hypothetical protein